MPTPCLAAVERGEWADLVCNECGVVVRTVSTTFFVKPEEERRTPLASSCATTLANCFMILSPGRDGQSRPEGNTSGISPRESLLLAQFALRFAKAALGSSDRDRLLCGRTALLPFN